MCSGSYIVWVYAKDGCGNISDGVSYVFHIDNDAPKVNHLSFEIEEKNPLAQFKNFVLGIFFRKNEVNGVTQTVTIQVEATDEQSASYVGGKNEIEEIKLYYVLDDGIINQREFPTIQNFETGVKGANDIYTFSFEKPERQKFYRLLIVAKDRAGNCNYLIPTQEEYNADLIMVDSIMPTVILAPDAKSAEVDSNQGGKKWYRKERKITYDSKISDVHSGLFESTVTINGREEKFGPYVDESTDKATFNKTNSVDIKTGDIDSIDGHVTLEAKVQDNAGNINTCTETIYIDEDAPVIGEILFTGGNKDELTALPTQYGFFFQNETKVTVKATDYIGKTSNYIVQIHRKVPVSKTSLTIQRTAKETKVRKLF